VEDEVSTNEIRRGQIAKRRAWIFTSKGAPRLADAFAGGEQRQNFWRYWVIDNLWNAADLAGHFAMKFLPMDACSNLGAVLGSFAMPRFHKVASQRARDTIRQLCPDMSESDREQLFRANCRAQGRLMAEFSIITRLKRHPERLELHGFDKIAKAVESGPVIAVGMHLGNWEIAPIILQNINVRAHTFYVPPKARAKAWIAERVRRKAGVGLLPPGAEGIKPAIDILKRGGVVATFCDEGFGGKIRGPFFGRTPHLEGNISTVIRLARITGATICPWYCIRRQGFRFSCHALEPLRLPPEKRPGARRHDDLLVLNSMIETVVRENLDQWYFLDNSLRPDQGDHIFDKPGP
jgi:KDO2-lipid IV(A) lauroyltransferase